MNRTDIKVNLLVTNILITQKPVRPNQLFGFCMIRALVIERKLKENFQEKLNPFIPILLVRKPGTTIFLTSFGDSPKKIMGSFMEYFLIYMKRNTWLNKSGNNEKRENNRRNPPSLHVQSYKSSVIRQKGNIIGHIIENTWAHQCNSFRMTEIY